MSDQPFARVAHYLADFLPVGGFVAMNFAVFAGWFWVLWTTLKPLKRICQQLPAVGAQLALACIVLAATVDTHELFQNIAVLLPFIQVTFLPTQMSLQVLNVPIQ